MTSSHHQSTRPSKRNAPFQWCNWLAGRATDWILLKRNNDSFCGNYWLDFFIFNSIFAFVFFPGWNGWSLTNDIASTEAVLFSLSKQKFNAKWSEHWNKRNERKTVGDRVEQQQKETTVGYTRCIKIQKDDDEGETIGLKGFLQPADQHLTEQPTEKEEKSSRGNNTEKVTNIIKGQLWIPTSTITSLDGFFLSLLVLREMRRRRLMMYHRRRHLRRWSIPFSCPPSTAKEKVRSSNTLWLAGKENGKKKNPGTSHFFLLLLLSLYYSLYSFFLFVDLGLFKHPAPPFLDERVSTSVLCVFVVRACIGLLVETKCI